MDTYVAMYVRTYVRIRIVVWVCAERTINCKSFNVPEEWTASIRARRQSPQTTYEPNLNLQVYVRTYVRTRLHVQTYVWVRTYVYIRAYVRTYAYVPPDACVYVRTFADVTNTRAFIFVGAHMLHGHFGFDRHTNAYTDANTYVYVCIRACVVHILKIPPAALVDIEGWLVVANAWLPIHNPCMQGQAPRCTLEFATAKGEITFRSWQRPGQWSKLFKGDFTV